jgi:phosphopantothenoylcysteine synthetase/decarboxylase
MKILVTGGNTFVPIDKVRGITNIFRGRTAGDIATEAVSRGHSVTLVGNKGMDEHCLGSMTVRIFKTFDELLMTMQNEITTGGYDAVIHSAAVSDYQVVRVTTPPGDGHGGGELRRGGKISSSHTNLVIELEPTIKIVDAVRSEWKFHGVLVKFKLQVDMSDGELISIAQKSREASDADIMVANCLEWARERAYILVRHEVLDTPRSKLAGALLDRVEQEHNQKLVRSGGFVS